MQLPAGAARAIALLEAAGYETWAVGGCVRDRLRGVEPHDYDLCTAATPAEMQTVFAGERVLETGLQHGTLTLLTADGPLEITTFRADGAYSDGRHPDVVRFVRSIRDDLARRDFTVGAMAWHPERGLFDPFGGQDDLTKGLLRAVGDPDTRFEEDALRILRAARFSAQFGFAIEEKTAAAMRRQRKRLSLVARERVQDELTRLLCGPFAGRALRTCRDVLMQPLPELAPMFDLDQQNGHHRYDVWEHTVRAVEQVPNDPLLRWAMLLHDCGKPACKTVDENGVGHFYGHPKVSVRIAAGISCRLRFSSEFEKKLLVLVAQHDRPLGDEEKIVRRRLAQIGEERFRQLLAIKKGDIVGQGTQPQDMERLCALERMLNGVIEAQQCISLRQLAVDGNDMRALGLTGERIGDMLHRLLEIVLDDPTQNTAEVLRRRARAIMEEDI